MFHLLGYNRTTLTTDVNAEMTAATDPSFSQRNGHYIFTEPYNLIGAYGLGLNVTEIRLNMPSLNAIGFHNLWPLRALALPTTPHVIQDLRSYPLLLPTNEEMSVQETDTVAQQANAFCWIMPPSQSFSLPQGQRRLTIRATATVTRGAQAWGAFGALTFEATLKGGWYTMVGCRVLEANSLAFQINFPRMPLVSGRKLFPGSYCNQAIGDLDVELDPAWLGAWGTFHTFEPPQLSIWATAAGAGSETLLMDLIFHGDNPPSVMVSSLSL